MIRFLGSVFLVLFLAVVTITACGIRHLAKNSSATFSEVQALLNPEASASAPSDKQEARNRREIKKMVAQMKRMCPMSAPGGVEMVDVQLDSTGKVVKCYYDLPSHAVITPEGEKQAKDLAIRLFKSKGLVKTTLKLGVTWNYIYRRDYGAVAFSLKIGPEDFQTGKPSGGNRSVPDQLRQTQEFVKNQMAETNRKLQNLNRVNRGDGSVKPAATKPAAPMKAAPTKAAPPSTAATPPRPTYKSPEVKYRNTIEQTRYNAQLRRNSHSGRTATGSDSGVLVNPFAP